MNAGVVNKMTPAGVCARSLHKNECARTQLRMVKPERSRPIRSSQSDCNWRRVERACSCFKSSCAAQSQVQGDVDESVVDIIVRDKESRPLSRVVAGSD